MVRGSVHDENAWSLGGVAGHAGVFSTADDLAILAQTILNGGTYGGAGSSARESVDALLHNENAEFPGNDHGLGFELNQRWYMDALSSPRPRATPATPAPRSSSTGVALVRHPADQPGAPQPQLGQQQPGPARRRPRHGAGHPGQAAHGPTAWFSGIGDARTATLTVPVKLGAAPSRLTLRPLVRHRGDRVVVLESSVGRRRHLAGAHALVRLVRARQWGTGSRWTWADSTGDVQLRWRYTSDALYQGRGVYVDGIQVTSRATPSSTTPGRRRRSVQPRAGLAAQT